MELCGETINNKRELLTARTLNKLRLLFENFHGINISLDQNPWKARKSASPVWRKLRWEINFQAIFCLRNSWNFCWLRKFWFHCKVFAKVANPRRALTYDEISRHDIHDWGAQGRRKTYSRIQNKLSAAHECQKKKKSFFNNRTRRRAKSGEDVMQRLSNILININMIHSCIVIMSGKARIVIN